MLNRRSIGLRLSEEFYEACVAPAIAAESHGCLMLLGSWAEGRRYLDTTTVCPPITPGSLV